MKKNLFLFALGLLTFMPAQAQQWGNRKTPSTFDMESAKRKMQMELILWPFFLEAKRILRAKPDPALVLMN